MRTNRRGPAAVFVTFEGADGSGKSTQLRHQAERLSSLGVRCLVTREPGGTDLGAEIRTLVLEPREPVVVPDAELLLYAADRAQHVHETIRPALEAGIVVLCDRYTDATVAYQGYGRGLDLDTIGQLNWLATGGLAPDLTLIFDLEVDEALRRLADRSGRLLELPTRFDLEAREFHERVRAGYMRIHEAEPERCRLVDAMGDVEIVAARVTEIVDRVLAERIG